MSIYHTIENISKHTTIHYRKQYSNDYVIARFYTQNEAVIHYRFSEYNYDRLNQALSSDLYHKKEVSMEFWNPEVCYKRHVYAERYKPTEADFKY